MFSTLCDLSLSTVVFAILAVIITSVVVPRMLKPAVTASGEKKEYMDLVSVGQILFDENKQEPSTCVHSVMVFKEKVEFSSFIEKFIKLCIKDSRFAQKLIHDDGERPYWVSTDESWDITDNIEYLQDELDQDQLSEKLGELCSTALDANTPLWRMVFLENYIHPETKELTNAMIWKYHHSIADGFTAMRHVMVNCVHAEEGKKLEDAFPKRRTPTKGAASRPSVASLLAKSVLATAKLVGLPKDPVNPVKPNYRLINKAQRVCAFGSLGETHSVTALKQMAQAASSEGKKMSVNDVLMAGLSRALGKFCEERKDMPGVQMPSDLLSAVWVSLSTGSPFEFHPSEPLWGNSMLGVVYLSLPISIKSVTEQIGAIYTRIRALVGSPEPLIANRLQALVAFLPYPIAHVVWPRVTDKISISVSNVPGPQAPLRWPVDKTESVEEQSLSSGVIEDIVFFVPPVNDIGIMATMMSYNDRVNLGVSTAGKWIDQASATHLVSELFPAAMAEMAAELIPEQK